MGIITNIGNFFMEFPDRFYRNFIYKDMWLYIADGLKTPQGNQEIGEARHHRAGDARCGDE